MPAAAPDDARFAQLSAALAAQSAALAAALASLQELRKENAALRPLLELLPELVAAREAAREEAHRKEAHRYNFISCLILTAQNGFGRDVEPFLALSRETWGEEQLFAAVKDLPHGALKWKDVTLAAAHPSQLLGKETVVDPFGKERTRLMYAAQAGDVARLRWLLARGARMELKDWKGHDALWWACCAGRMQTMEALLSLGAAVSTALHGASAGGHLEMVRALLGTRGVELELQDREGRTALWRACDAGRVEIERELRERGAAPVDNCYWRAAQLAVAGAWSPLHNACEKGHLEVLQALLVPGGAQVAAVHGASGGTPLHVACWKGDLAIVRELLRRGAAIDAVSSGDPQTNGATPLIFACKFGHFEVVRELIARGAVVRTAQADSQTPLYVASAQGHLQVVRELLAHGAAVDAVVDGGASSLFGASYGGHTEIVRLLILRGANRGMVTQNNSTALSIATAQGHGAIVALLRQGHGAIVALLR